MHLIIHQHGLLWQGENKKNAELFRIQRFYGGEDATRTHNALRHTTFPMWLLTIRIPLRVALDYYNGCFEKNQDLFQNFFAFFFFRFSHVAAGLNSCKSPYFASIFPKLKLNLSAYFVIMKQAVNSFHLGGIPLEQKKRRPRRGRH